MKKSVLLITLLFAITLSSCKQEEDPNKVTILKTIQKELIKDCQRNEDQLRVKFQGLHFVEDYLTISKNLSQYVYANIDTTLNSTSSFDSARFNTEYRKIIMDHRIKVKHTLYLKEDSIAIFSTLFKQSIVSANPSVSDKLLNNIYILNQHLKVLRVNNETSMFGCWLDIIQQGYGSSDVYENADSTKITLTYTSSRSKFLITDVTFSGLFDQHEKEVKNLNYFMNDDKTIIIRSGKLKKGSYIARIKYRLIKETGDSSDDEANLPVTIW